MWSRPSLLTIAVIAAAVGWQGLDLRQRRARDFAAQRRFTEALASAVDGLAVREFRGGVYNPAALGEALADARRRFELAYVAITASATPLAEAGTRPLQPEAELWCEQPFVPLKPLGRGTRAGFAGDTRPTPGDPLTLQVALDGAPLRAHLAADLQRMLVTSAALASLCVLVALAFVARERRAALRSELSASRGRLAGLDTLRRLGAGLVHETKNPLGVVRGFAERLAQGQIAADEVRETARAIVDETDRTVARIDEFLLLSRPAMLRRGPVVVRDLFAQLAKLLLADLDAAGARLVVRAEAVTIDADHDQLRRLLLNLLLNASQAVAGAGGGTIELSCERTVHGVMLSVADDGGGVPQELRETMFEPYVSGRPGGSGLGLAIARRIASDHGFTLRHEPREPRGTRMVLEVPQ